MSRRGKTLPRVSSATEDAAALAIGYGDDLVGALFVSETSAVESDDGAHESLM